MENINNEISGALSRKLDVHLNKEIDNGITTPLYSDLCSLFINKLYIRLGNQLLVGGDTMLNNRFYIEIVKGYEKSLKR